MPDDEKQNTADYSASIGDVWRKDGPVDSMRVNRRLFPDEDDYDGGLQGISCDYRTMDGWTRSVFVPARSDEEFAEKMIRSGRHLEND